jgi:predicted ArsR family transcriptional regulator
MPSDNGSEWLTTWQENTSGFDRVKSVTMTLMEPQPASWIAEEAVVSSSMARAHLDRLIDLGVVTTSDEGGVRHYYPDPLYTQLRDLHELLDDTTKQRLADRAAELKDEIDTWQTDYDAASPDALRERAASDAVSADHAYELVQIANDWEYARYRLSLIQEAMENYDSFTRGPASISA